MCKILWLIKFQPPHGINIWCFGYSISSPIRSSYYIICFNLYWLYTYCFFLNERYCWLRSSIFRLAHYIPTIPPFYFRYGWFTRCLMVTYHFHFMAWDAARTPEPNLHGTLLASLATTTLWYNWKWMGSDPWLTNGVIKCDIWICLKIGNTAGKLKKHQIRGYPY